MGRKVFETLLQSAPILAAGFLCLASSCLSQWTQTGPYGAYVYTLTVSGPYILAGTSNGVYLSSDDGQTWIARNSGMLNTSIDAFTAIGTNLIAGGVGIFLSSDNGQNWVRQNTLGVTALVNSGANLFCASGGVYQSSDNGASWISVSAGLPPLSHYGVQVRALAASGSILFAAAAGGGVYRSTDNGQSWFSANTGLTDPAVNILLVAGPSLYAGTLSGGVFLSTDAGASWSLKKVLPGSVAELMVSGNDLFASCSDISGNSPASSGLFRSSGGDNWVAVSNGLVEPNGRVFVSKLVVKGATLFAGGDWGVFRSANNGSSWTSVNTGLTNLTINTLAVSGSVMYAGTEAYGVFRSTDGGAHWGGTSAGPAYPRVHCLAIAGTNLIAGTWGGGVFRSADSSASWLAVNTGFPSWGPYSYGYYAVPCLTLSGGILFAGTEGAGLQESPNLGNWWTTDTGTGLTDLSVESLLLRGTDIYAGTGGSVFLSTDNGAHWRDRGLTLTKYPIYSLAVLDSVLIAGTPGGVAVTADNGDHWADASAGLTNLNVHAFAVADSRLFAGTDDGMALSMNHGKTWAAVDSGLKGVKVYALAISGGNLLAGTTIGIFKRPLSELYTDVRVSQVTLPATMQLWQNYPNPFNPSTTIRYWIPQRSYITLSVYNTLGQLIMTLVNEDVQAGYHEVKFDGSNLATGVYFCRLQAGSFVKTMKLLLVR